MNGEINKNFVNGFHHHFFSTFSKLIESAADAATNSTPPSRNSAPILGGIVYCWNFFNINLCNTWPQPMHRLEGDFLLRQHEAVTWNKATYQ